MEALDTLREDGRPNFRGTDACEIRSLDVKPGEVLVLKHPDGITMKVREQLNRWGEMITREFGCRVILMSEALNLEKLVIGGSHVEVHPGDGKAISGEAFERIADAVKAGEEVEAKGRRLIANIERWVSTIERRIEISESSDADCREWHILRTEALGRIQEFREGKMPYAEIERWFKTHKSR